MRASLPARGYEVRTATNGQEAINEMHKEMPDLVILDLVMPEMSGLEVCRRVREFSQVPIIVLSAKGSERDKVAALDAGADDYVTKPFGMDELLARLRAVLRRQSALEANASVMTVGDLTINSDERLVIAAGREIKLTPKEFEVLKYLHCRASRSVSSVRLAFPSAWPNEAFNHGGNATAACLSGVLGYLFGIGAVFVLMTGMAVAAIAATAIIRSGDIDHARARGPASAGSSSAAPASFATLMRSVPLLILGVTLMLFHMANAAMLPLLGQAMVARGTAGDASAYTAATVVVPDSPWCPWRCWPRAWPSRAAIGSFSFWLWWRCRSGAAGRIQCPSVDLASRAGSRRRRCGDARCRRAGARRAILSGTGHVNAGLGAVMAMQGVGAALQRNHFGGYVAQRLGYGTAFLALGSIAVLALMVWLVGNSLVAIGREPSFKPAAR